MIGAVRSFSKEVRDILVTRPDRVRLGVEVALALALSVQLAQAGWILLRPAMTTISLRSGPSPAVPADLSIFDRFDAFFRTSEVSSLAEASAAGSSQMRLFGVRAGGADGGSAIIGLADGRQVSVGVGEEVEPGLVLQSVGPDHVTLARGSSISRLIFSDTPVGAAPPPPPPPGPQTLTPRPAPAAVSAAPAAALISRAGLRPRMRGARMDGFTVSDGGDPAVLRAAGLRPGDVILAVNGQPLDSLERITALRGQLAGSDSADIRFERDGVVQTSTLGTGR